MLIYTKLELLDLIKLNISFHRTTLSLEPTHFFFLNINDLYILKDENDLLIEDTEEKRILFDQLVKELGLVEISFIKLPKSELVNPTRFMCCHPTTHNTLSYVEVENHSYLVKTLTHNFNKDAR